MAKYVIRGDFGISNEIEIINAINDLQAYYSNHEFVFLMN